MPQITNVKKKKKKICDIKIILFYLIHPFVNILKPKQNETLYSILYILLLALH